MGRRDEFVGIGLFRGNRGLFNELQDSRVLGNGDFAEQILRQTEAELPSEKITLDSIVEAVMATLDVTETELMSRTRAMSLANARSIICHMAYVFGHRVVDIARRLNIAGAGVTVAARRGKELIKNYPDLTAFGE
jgi:hypothetical protein